MCFRAERRTSDFVTDRVEQQHFANTELTRFYRHHCFTTGCSSDVELDMKEIAGKATGTAYRGVIFIDKNFTNAPEHPRRKLLSYNKACSLEVLQGLIGSTSYQCSRHDSRRVLKKSTGILLLPDMCCRQLSPCERSHPSFVKRKVQGNLSNIYRWKNSYCV